MNLLVSLLILKFVPSGLHYVTNFRIGILGHQASGALVVCELAFW